MGKYDWNRIKERATKVVEVNGKFSSIADLARDLEIPQSTVFDALIRGDLVEDELVDKTAHQHPFEQEKPIRAQIRGNRAKIKYNAADPLEPDELLEVAGLDPAEWKITDQEITAWQMGRKKKQVDLNWEDGKATGSVLDEGEIHKEYLYRIAVSLTRINRIPVKAVLQPIQVVDDGLLKTDEPMLSLGTGDDPTEILFIADPHFGFKRLQDNTLLPFQDREFLGGLLSLSSYFKPDLIVWNGDALDLPDVSSFHSDPAILQNVQAAGIEFAWLLGQFKEHCSKQAYLEGNHEERLQREMKKNFQAAFNLKPIHDLQGAPMMSISRFLGLESLGVEWIDGYPDNFLQVGKVRFEHGSTVRKGSARTVAAEIDSATVSRFFGHIHRTELASKHIGDQGKEIFVGSPGCSCIKGRAPGSRGSSNWQTGAFWISLDADGEVASVELISKSKQTEGALMRGFHFQGNYFEQFLSSLPEEWSNLFQFSPIA